MRRKNNECEEGFGLQEAAKLQSKLEADAKRRDKDMQKLNVQLGEEVDEHDALRKTCEMVRERVRRDEIKLIFEEKDIRKAVHGETMKLKRHTSDLKEEVCSAVLSMSVPFVE